MAKRELITWSIDKAGAGWSLSFGNLNKREAEEIVALVARLQGSRDHDPLSPAEWEQRFKGLEQ